MTLPTLRVRRRFWRMLAPKWSHRPLDGTGAATHGGRYNPPGRPALYMSEDAATAIAEYEQELGIRPGMLCVYEVDVAEIVDLCDATICKRLRIDSAALHCAWKEIAFIRGGRPPSWTIANRLFKRGASGVYAPSTRQAGGRNLVLWRWNDGPARSVKVLDPLGDLPRNQRSWQ